MAAVRLPEVLAALRSAEEPRLVVLPESAGSSPDSVALVSGSFDPITVAHAALADAGRARAAVVVLVYSARTLPKEVGSPEPLLSEDRRIEALQRFCRARPGTFLGLCSHGLLVDQVTAARERFPTARLMVLMGSDKVLQLLDPKWYGDRDRSLRRLFDQAEVLYALREGDEETVARALGAPENRPWLEKLSGLDVGRDVASVSSRMVRDLVRRGVDVTGLVPTEVLPIPGLGA